MPDADDLTRTARDLRDDLDVWLLDRPPETVTDRLGLLVAVRDLTARCRLVEAALNESLDGDVEGPVEVDGRWFAPGSTVSTRGWRRDDLRRTVTGHALVDENGELRTAQEAVDAMWEWVDVATGRTAKLRAIGITADEYAETSTRTFKLEEAK